MLAVLLCGAIFFVSQLLLPPPDAGPIEDPAMSSAVTDGSERAPGVGREGTPTAEGREGPVAESTDLPVLDEVRPEVHSDLLSLGLTNRSHNDGGMVVGMHLRSPQFAEHETAVDALRLHGQPTLEVNFADAASDFRIPRGATYALVEQTKTEATFRHTQADVEIEERIELLGGYEATLEVTVTNRSSASQNHRMHIETRLGVNAAARYDIQRGLCRMKDGLEAWDRGDVEDEAASFEGPVQWGGVDSKYFGSLLVPTPAGAACEIRLSADKQLIENDIAFATIGLEPGASYTHRIGLFMGPKEVDRLRDFSAVPRDGEHDLEEAIDWGYLGIVTETLGKWLLALLRWIHQLTNDWGWSIVLLTIVVKVLMLPLTLKQMSSMKAMKRIQPEIQAIKEKYADDRTKQGQEMQALFGRSGVNPLAGCLPLVVQLPIYVALYAMLGAVVELVHVPFLWLPDLTQEDPYYILPLALGGAMIVQNRMMPMAGDEAQAQMMRWVMPAIFTAFMLFLPSGLGVYIFVNIVLSVIQTALQLGRSSEAAEASR